MIPNPASIRALVTGGAGFIGSHLVQHLLDLGISATVFDNFSAKRNPIWDLICNHDNLSVIQGDVRDREAVESVVQGHDWVFHHAAQVSVPQSIANPVETFDVNCGGSLNVLEAARKSHVQRVVMASSCAVYGDKARSPIIENQPLYPVSPYGTSKAIMENIADSYFLSHGLESICLRYFNVYGKGQSANSEYAAVIPKFIQCVRNQTAPIIYGDGLQSRDFIHINDVIAANLKAMFLDSPILKKSRKFNIGTGHSTTLFELLNLIYDLEKCELQPLYESERIGDIRVSFADPSRSREDLGFCAQEILKQGLSQILKS